MNKLILFVFFFSHASQALTAKEIMTKNEEARKINEFESRAVLKTQNQGGTEKVKDFTLWRKVQANGIHNSTLTRFHAPAEVKNEGILIIENPAGKNDVLLYLPNFKKTRRVESQQQSGSFMGSVFSYSDIATPHVEDYQYKTLGTEKCPNEPAKNCTKIECVPSNEEVRERTGYSKSIAWVREDNFMVEKAEYFQLDGKLMKKLNATEIKMVDPKNQKWLAHRLKIVHQITQDSTELVFSKVKVNSGIPDSTFTQQNLQKVK